MKYLTHCTTFLNALHILFEGTINFGDLRYSNDLEEFELHNEDDATLYAFCTFLGSLDEIDSLLWLAYSGRKHGASITFCFNDDADFGELFGNDPSIEHFKIEYSEFPSDRISEDCSKLGKIKSKKFEEENEYRFLIKKDKIYVNITQAREINFSCLSNIVLTVDSADSKLASDIFFNNKSITVKSNDFIR